MSIVQPYPAPPIIDAIVELRFKAPLHRREHDRAVKALKPCYDIHKEMTEVDVQLKVENGKIEAQPGKSKIVHVLSNNDQNDFCRVEESKFHWSRLPPYEGWPRFETRVIRDVQNIRRKIRFPNLERVGVRYRNRIDVPEDSRGVFSYEEYLSVNINLPNLLNPHDGYQWKIDKHFAKKEISATVISGIIPSEIPGTIAVLLDIDVYVVDNLPADEDNLSKKIGLMRALKNEIFEACVTDKARESFK
ncbi:TIGR04255 family protein [Phenylobacterium sp.]|jgi:uncharacterized protein (TIGR04255 family)|uniref:TIGR04255 family protein n=1 Tax=Phenylobacterium sp. TaxID=1871053 RepID=UPI0025DCB9BF|nr:TIGR04255 family protein [Phenylobacterium sp.]MCA3722216.1 TIGR04255 family protein [Phenylobacterium sp.]